MYLLAQYKGFTAVGVCNEKTYQTIELSLKKVVKDIFKEAKDEEIEVVALTNVENAVDFINNADQIVFDDEV